MAVRLSVRGAFLWVMLLALTLAMIALQADTGTVLDLDFGRDNVRDNARDHAHEHAHERNDHAQLHEPMPHEFADFALGNAPPRYPSTGIRWPKWRIGASDTPDEAARRRWELARATQYAGTGARIQRFLEKARRGEPFTVATLGGSVSKGRGLRPPEPGTRPPDAVGADTLYSKENLHMLIFEWLNATFPHPENRFVNGAQGGVGAGYFAWCFKEHIDEHPDLVLLELGINDLNSINVASSYEHLVRSVLELDSSPAMINIETFTTLFPALQSSSALHGDILAYYDVPSFGIRDILLPRILANPDTQLPRWFRTGEDVKLGDHKVREWGGMPVDLMHISAKGHALAAGLVINYLSTQLALIAPSGWSRLAPGRHRMARVYSVPGTSLTQSFTPGDLPEKRSPMCRSMISGRRHNRVSGTDSPSDKPEDLVQGVVLDGRSHGWENWSWVEKHYLVARIPGSLAVFDFVTSEGEEPTAPENEVYPDPLDVYEPAREANPTGNENPPQTRRDQTAEDADSQIVFAKDDGSTPPRLMGRRRLAIRRTTKQATEGAAPKRASKKGNRGGTVSIGYLRSANYGLGSVFCWVDDDVEGGKRLDGYWSIKERNMGMVDPVATGLKPGRHTLSCKLLPDSLDPLGRKEFRLFSIMHD